MNPLCRTLAGVLPALWLVVASGAAAQLPDTAAAPPDTVPDPAPGVRIVPSMVDLDLVINSAAIGRTHRLREIGTSIGRFRAESLNHAPITGMADLLTGRVAGLVVQDVSGTTGTSQRLRIRGARSLTLSGEPLIFVDGARINSDFGGLGVGGQEPGRLNDLNPQDIARVDVVKGPAALAAYGTDGANGVILISTKRGTPGETRWQFFAETGTVTDITDYPANYATYQIDTPGEPLFTPSGGLNLSGYSFCANLLAASGRCRQDGTISFNTLMDPRTTPFSTGTRQRIGASVRGGNEDARYFVSGQLEDETGVIFFNRQERVNLRANLDATPSESVEFSASVGYSSTDLALNYNDNALFSPILQGLVGYPNFRPRPDDATYEGQNSANYGFGFNLPALAERIPFQDVHRFTTSGGLRWRPARWLTLNATGALDYTSRHDSETFGSGVGPNSSSALFTSTRDSRRSSAAWYTGTASGTARYPLADGVGATTTLGVQYDQQGRSSTACGGWELLPGTQSCGTASVNLRPDEDFFQVRTLGLYLQQEFDLRDRVFLSAGLRADDSSTFGERRGFAWFPSAQLSWVLSEEPFFPDLEVLDLLRIRGGWGQAGLRPGFRDAARLYGGVGGPARVQGISLVSTGNSALGPERVTETEAGFEAVLFDDRLAVDFTWFNQENAGAIVPRRLVPSLGLSGCTPLPDALFCEDVSRQENLARTRNRGTELGVRLQVLDTDPVGLRLGFLNATLDNEIVELGLDEPLVFNRNLQRHQEGYPAGGFWQRPVSWTDADSDGQLSCERLFTGESTDPCEVAVGDEAEYIGPALPTWQRSVFADLRLFGFATVSTLFEGRGGFFKGNDSEAFRCGFRSRRGCAAVGDPTASLQEQAAYIADRYLGSAAGYVERADFWRWRELSVALDVPEAVSRRVSALAGLRVTLAARNLAVFTDYDGIDPETNEAGSDAPFRQSEFNTQPPVRYLMLRMDYSF